MSCFLLKSAELITLHKLSFSSWLQTSLPPFLLLTFCSSPPSFLAWSSCIHVKLFQDLQQHSSRGKTVKTVFFFIYCSLYHVILHYIINYLLLIICNNLKITSVYIWYHRNLKEASNHTTFFSLYWFVWFQNSNIYYYHLFKHVR